MITKLRALRLSWLPSLLMIMLLGSVCLPDEWIMWRQAEQARLAGHWHSALQTYTQLKQNHDPRVRLAQSRLWLIRGDWHHAERSLEHVLTQPLTPRERDRAWMWYGWALLQQKRFQPAAEAWTHVSDGQDSTLSVLYVEHALAQGEIISAALRLNTIDDVDPEWRPVYELRAAQLAFTSAPSTTQTILEALTIPQQLFPGSPLTVEEYAQARATLQAAAAAPPEARMIILAQQWASQGLPQAAWSLLRDVPASSDYWPLAINTLAEIQLAHAMPVQAQQTLEQGLAAYNNIAELWRTYVSVALALEDIEQASAALDQAVALEGFTAEHYTLAASIAYAAGDYDQVKQSFDTAIKSALTQELSGTYALAAANFYVAIPLQPCSTARTYVQQALNSEVDTAARLLEGQLALRCHEPEQALQIIAPLQDQTQPTWAYIQGAALLQLGNEAEGRSYLEYVIDHFPRSIWRYKAEQLLTS